MFAVLELARSSDRGRNSSWYLVAAVFTAPFIVLAPLNGAISNSLPKRWVLTGSGIVGLLALLFFMLLAGNEPGSSAIELALFTVALSSAIFNPVRYALLPAAAQDAGVPLTRVNGWIELGAACGIIGGVGIAVALGGVTWLARPASLLAAVALSALAVVTAIPADFPSDVRRPESVGQALAGFFRDALRIAGDSESRASMVALAAFLGLITAGSGAVVMHTLGSATGSDKELPLLAMLLVSTGAAVGSVLAGMVPDPRRCLGLVPFGAFGLLFALSWAAATLRAGLPLLPCLLLGLMSGLANVPLRAAYQAAVPADARGNGMAVSNFFIYLFTTILSLLMFLLAGWGTLNSPLEQLVFLGALCGIAAVVAAWTWRRQTVELVLGGSPRPTPESRPLPEKSSVPSA